MKDYKQLLKKYNGDDLKIVHELSDNLTDTRYLFEVIFKALQAYREKIDKSEFYYLEESMNIGMKQLRTIEDALSEITPIIIQ